VSVVIVGVIRRKPVLTHASIVCEGMLASVNSVNWEQEPDNRPTIAKYRDTAVSCAKTAEPIEMLFGLWTHVGPRKRC